MPFVNPFVPASAAKTHRKYAPSSISRILKCPPSVDAGQARRDFSSDEAANGGQVGHDIFEICMRDGGGADRFIGRKLTPSDGADFILEVDRHFARAVDLALAAARRLSVELPPFLTPGIGEGSAFLEHEVSLRGYEDLCGGTADLVRLSATVTPNGTGWFLDIFDLKMGFLEVDAEANGQLFTYAACALDEFGVWGQVEFVRLTIAQPRLFYGEKIKTVVVPVATIAEFRDTLVRTIDACERGTMDFIAGPHCRYCEKLGMCPASQNLMKSLVEMIAQDPATAPSAALTWFIDHRKVYEAFVRRAEFVAKDRAMKGEDMGGRPLVMSTTHRQWRDEPAAVRTLLEGLGPDAVQPPTPAQVIDRFPEWKGWVEENSFRPRGSVVLGKIGDTRTRYSRPSLLARHESIDLSAWGVQK